ncbi:MAG: hypothetical protein K2I69_02630, partial [Muribaculaceae bacterium]|nr:hypothetical protein [Muribaculaceae bacterium]
VQSYGAKCPFSKFFEAFNISLTLWPPYENRNPKLMHCKTAKSANTPFQPKSSQGFSTKSHRLQKKFPFPSKIFPTPRKKSIAHHKKTGRTPRPTRLKRKL